MVVMHSLQTKVLVAMHSLETHKVLTFLLLKKLSNQLSGHGSIKQSE